MLPSISTAIRRLRRPSSSNRPVDLADDRDLVAFMNESRTDAERRQVAYVASLRHGRR